jgi:hypothetical protein
MEEAQKTEIVKENKKKKSAPAKRKVDAAARAKVRAEEIRKEQETRSNTEPGTVVGGDTDLYSYYYIANGLDSSDSQLALAVSRGYERCTEGEKMIGMQGGHLYRCPKEITDERMRKRALKYKR